MKEIDLSSWDRLGQTNRYHLIKRRREYVLRACGQVAPCGGSICQTKPRPLSMGNVSSATLNFNNDQIIVQYEGGDKCPQNILANQTAEVRFICDKSVDSCQGYPALKFSLPCHDVFEWKTKLVCEDAHEECPSNAAVIRPKKKAKTTSFAFLWGLLFLFVTYAGFVGYTRVYYRSPVSDFASWMRRIFGNIRTGVADDDQFLIPGDIQVPTFGSLNDEDDDELILA